MRDRVVAAGAALAFIVLCQPAQAQEIPLKAGQSSDLHPVYWVDKCQSILKRIVSVEKLSGPASVTLSIREQPVQARRQNCPGDIPGGMVVATAGAVASASTETIEYRVVYDTEVGTRQSTHKRTLLLSP
ncbi:MAG: hypothetical protein AB7F36_16530 [Reyranellaceae bacterium]